MHRRHEPGSRSPCHGDKGISFFSIAFHPTRELAGYMVVSDGLISTQLGLGKQRSI
jgi:hypothetical protein